MKMKNKNLVRCIFVFLNFLWLTCNPFPVLSPLCGTYYYALGAPDCSGATPPPLVLSLSALRMVVMLFFFDEKAFGGSIVSPDLHTKNWALRDMAQTRHPNPPPTPSPLPHLLPLLPSPNPIPTLNLILTLTPYQTKPPPQTLPLIRNVPHPYPHPTPPTQVCAMCGPQGGILPCRPPPTQLL